MKVTILHHSGDANVPAVRVPGTRALAAAHRGAVVVTGLTGPEFDALARALPLRVVTTGVFHPATDTLTEVTGTMPYVLEIGTTTLYISTEPGHVGRAALIARICYLGCGVRIVAAPSAPGAYRSPWRRTAIDAVRAVLFRLTRRVVMW